MRRLLRPWALRTALALAALLVAVLPRGAGGQEPEPGPLVQVPAGGAGWNTGRVLELVERARERRRIPVADSALRSYRADVAGYIYFFIDREGEPDPVLLRADQVALDLYWAQPGRVKQVVKGLRSEEQFPIRDFAYYLDRYTVIQNGFDDVIRVGEGRDVRNVLHPLSVQGAGVYDFRLADSTTIRLPGRTEPLRVYQIHVRPRNFDIPAIVGSIWVERTRGDLVRLAFTFTPAAYVDPRNERVEVMLENALWEGQYWLPREQRLLVRREIPELDLDVGTVIRGGLTVRDYDFNVEVADGFFRGREVVLGGRPDALADYPFETGLYEGFEEVGLAEAEPGTLDAVDVDAIAGEILRERFLRGIPRLRLFAPTVSDVVRYGRTEGLVLGIGTSIGVGASQLYGYGGWAFGRDRPLALVGWGPAGPEAGTSWTAEAFLNQPAEVGLRPAASGVMASLSAAVLGHDLRDIYLRSGARIGVELQPDRGRRWGFAAAYERHSDAALAARAAPFDDDRLFRPSTPAEEDDRVVLTAEHERTVRLGDVTVRLRPEVRAVLRSGSRWSDETCFRPHDDVLVEVDCTEGPFARVGVDARADWRAASLRHGASARATAALVAPAPPPQDYLYIGGRNTVPGHPFHAYAGTRAAAADLTVWTDLVPRLMRLRAIAAAGWTGGQSAIELPRPRVGDDPDQAFPPPPVPPHDPWTPSHTDGLASAVGIGVGLVDGVLRLDWMVRTDTGAGTLILSVDPGLWSFL